MVSCRNVACRAGSALSRLCVVLGLAVTLGLAAAPALAQEPQGDFGEWLAALRAEAAERGVDEPILNAALGGIEPIPRVIELDRSQPEFTLTFEEYLGRVVPDSRVRKGREMLARNKALLDSIGAQYGVQPRFIVALWGIETDFGRITGGFKVIPALATLAHDGRRSAYFRGELLNALQILDEGHIAPDAMMGSWAGAMGQCQFMPSSFLRYAVDHDGDGHKDIWGTRADVFASAANYLKNVGWDDSMTWGRAVRLPADLDPALAGLDNARPLPEWQELGVRRADGSALPTRPLDAALVSPAGKEGPSFLVYQNFRATMRWNTSTYFALAVGHLADRIGGR